MADIGYNWDANWTPIDAAIVLTQGGTIIYSSETLDLDGKVACLIKITRTTLKRRGWDGG